MNFVATAYLVTFGLIGLYAASVVARGRSARRDAAARTRETSAPGRDSGMPGREGGVPGREGGLPGREGGSELTDAEGD